jgi:hypothetical protein
MLYALTKVFIAHFCRILTCFKQDEFSGSKFNAAAMMLLTPPSTRLEKNHPLVLTLLIE